MTLYNYFALLPSLIVLFRVYVCVFMFYYVYYIISPLKTNNILSFFFILRAKYSSFYFWPFLRYFNTFIPLIYIVEMTEEEEEEEEEEATQCSPCEPNDDMLSVVLK